MGMGDGDGERVCRIGARDPDAGQQPLHHRPNLLLAGAAGTDHRLLHQCRGIFANLDAAPRCGEQHDAAGLAELQGRLGIFVDEYFLDGGRDRAMFGNDRGQRVGKEDEPLRERP